MSEESGEEFNDSELNFASFAVYIVHERLYSLLQCSNYGGPQGSWTHNSYTMIDVRGPPKF